MKTFNIGDYGNQKVVMHCKTEEEAIDFCELLYSLGLKWSNGSNYVNTYWQHHQEGTCYEFNGNLYDDIGFYMRRGYEILEWSDFMNKVFTKSNLKTGDVIKRRNGDVEIFIANLGVFIRADGEHSKISQINEDLTAKSNNSRWDIVAVRRPNRDYECSFSAFDSFFWVSKGLGKLVYEREESVEMTFAEVCAALGRDIKIVKE